VQTITGHVRGVDVEVDIHKGSSDRADPPEVLGLRITGGPSNEAENKEAAELAFEIAGKAHTRGLDDQAR